MKLATILLAAASMTLLGACASTSCKPCPSKHAHSSDKTDSYVMCKDGCPKENCPHSCK